MSKRNLTVLDNSKAVTPTPSRPKFREFDKFVEEMEYIAFCSEPARSLEKQICTGNGYDSQGVKKETLPGRHQDAIKKIDHAIKLYESVNEDRARWEAFLDEGAEKYADPDDEDGALSLEYVSLQVGMLLGSFATTKISDPDVFVPTLIEEIRAAGPSWCVLESACRTIRRTMKTAPSIAAVLETIREEEDVWAERAQKAWGTGYAVGRLKEVRATIAEDLRKAADGHSHVAATNPLEDIKTPSTMVPGEHVRHSKFGFGFVEQVDGNKLTVEFYTVGRKMVLDSFVERAEEERIEP
jgi:hypothetical protein